ncbi:hypothetical protein GCM10010433_49890 [Streptomyces pulveraceus]|uniref:Uncharacterized protein n=1 Tax=Streptomyces pulveraceus TaxID=68258 RepID=A0ABW1GHX9_9ACTN
MTQHEPDVAFGLHPELGVVAAVADDNQYLTEVLEERGFVYHESHELSVLPSDIPHNMAVPMLDAITEELHEAGWAVTVNPAILTLFRSSAAVPVSTSSQRPATAPSGPRPPAPPPTTPLRGTGRTR